MQTSLKAIAQQAKTDKRYRFTNLSGLLTHGLLNESFSLLNKKAATGVDGVTDAEYGKNLNDNITNLLERVKTGKYRARFVRRKHINCCSLSLCPGC